MAISSCSDWPLACINSCRSNSHGSTLIPACKILSILSVSCSKFQNFRVNSSGCSPSPILEEASGSLPVVELNVDFPDSEQCTVPDSDNLNDLLRRLFGDPKTQELAFDYYEKLKQRPEFRPDKSTLKHVIRYLSSSKKWHAILLLFKDFKNYHVFPDASTCSRLVSSCIRARKFKIVETFLEDFKSNREVSTVLTFGSAMRGYNKLHMYRSTIVAFRKMKSAGVFPDPECYCHIMEACGKLGDSQKLIQLFNELQTRDELDFYSSPFCTRIYGILCESLAKSGRAFEALDYMREMTEKGISKDSSLYSALICCFAGMREVKVAEETYEEAKSKKMVRDPGVYLKLVLMYVEEGPLEKTLEIVKAMKDSGLRISDCIFCAIVNGFSKKRGFLASVNVYEELILQGCEAGQVTYSSIINAYSNLGLHWKAEMVFSEMQQKGFDRCVVAYSSIIVMYGKTGRLRDAMRVLAKMKEKGCQPNVWIYNSLMEMHGRAKNLRQVEKLWKEMKRRKVGPDKVSYTSVISAYSKAGELEICMRYYNEFRINGGVIDRAMAGIMVGVFSRSSRIDELVKLLRDMKSEGTRLDGRLYHSALDALSDAGLQGQAQWLQESFATTYLNSSRK